MQYRAFGDTGIDISALGFGAMRLPSKQSDGKTVFDADEGVRVMHRAFELGVNYIDTAPYYCGGESEVIVGRAVNSWRGAQRIYVSTKNPVESESGDEWRKRLEDSLGKLQRDSIDFYHMWGIGWETYETKIDVKNGPLEAARRARDEGLIGHISFSFHDKPESMIRLVDTGVFETVLCQYNLLDRANEEAISHASAKGLGVVVMGPVAGGRLGQPSDVIQKLLPRKMSGTAEIALRFVLAHPGVDCALSGMSTTAMVEENARAASDGAPLTAGELSSIQAAMEENRRMAELYCTGCGYCMPCPHDINIPLNFQLMNYHRVYGITEYARQQYQKIGTNEWMKGKKAEECVECGECEAKCPQKIAIREQLRQTAEVLSR